MNIKNKIRNILLLFIVLISKILSGQQNELGIPLIQNISPKDYGYESQNYDIIQDDRGILYVGNVSGILEYDGTDWRLIDINGIPNLTLGSDNNVYASGYNDFGFLSSENYTTIYKSLIEELPKNERNLGDIVDVLSLQDEIIFYTNEKIYRWDYKYLTVIDSSETPFNIFKVEDKLFVSKPGIGILNYVHNGFDTLPNARFFKNKTIQEILYYENGKLLIKTEEDRGFFIYDYNSIVPFHTQVDEYIFRNDLTKGHWLASGHYVFGTERCGVSIIDKMGKLIVNINREKGLKDDQINDIYIDNYNNMWLALSNGICKIEFPSAFSFFGKTSGIKGGISSIIKQNGILYVATTQGVFYLKKIDFDNNQLNCLSSEKFKRVEDIQINCNILKLFDNRLYITSDAGVYLIEDFKGKLVYDKAIDDIKQSRRDSNIYYFGTKKGLFIFENINGDFKEIGKLNKLDKTVRSIAEDENGVIWMGSNYNGVYMLDFSKGIDLNADVINIKESYNLPKEHGWIDVYPTKNGIIFSTQKGVYRFNHDSLKFYPDELLGINFENNNCWVYPIVEDKDYNLWLSSGKYGEFYKSTAYGKFYSEKTEYNLNTAIFKNIADFTIEAIFPDENGVVWFGSFDGLIRYDYILDYRQSVKYNTLIRRIIIGEDSVLYNGVNNNFFNKVIHPEFKYKYNSFHFEFSAPNFISASEIQYQYFLEGYDKTWSKWQDVTSINYTNLHEGIYTFRVKAKDLYDNISQEAVFHFHIKPPIYRTWYAYISYILFISLFIIMILRWREYLFAQEKFRLEKTISEKTEEIVIQKERAEQLVANILPPDTAKELQIKGKASRKMYKMATVLFSDIQGFTEIAEYMNPEKLLDDLDKFFFDFDNVVEDLNIEKIKTIGDAYMCAGGIPVKNRTNPIDVVQTGIIMQQHMKTLKDTSENDWNIRIGIHSGPIIAGVVGSKKLSYDIWGDTVNVASRMESSGKIGEINISETTYELVKDFFVCETRGKIPVKYKGDITMYFVRGIKPELSVNGEGIEPNEIFNKKLQYIRYDDLEELIMHRLEKGIPENIYYHNLKHTIDVVVETEIIGRSEGVSKDDLFLLKTAALFHDTGFIIGYEDHELLSIKFSKEVLQEFHYTEEQINIICDLIYATHPNVEPKTHLEKIICDADLDYLGREDYLPVSQNLFRELFERGMVKTIDDWHKKQIKFFEEHKYHTKSAHKMRNNNKMKHLEELKKLV